MASALEQLIKKAQSVPMSAKDKEDQRRSFAYGNTHFENAAITRDMIDSAAERLAAAKK